MVRGRVQLVQHESYQLYFLFGRRSCALLFDSLLSSSVTHPLHDSQDHNLWPMHGQQVGRREPRNTLN